MNPKFCFTLLLVTVSALTTTQADAVMKNDPKRPVADISKDLGITPEQFIACFNNVSPTPGGNRPESGERVRANKAVLLPCLQEANAEITNERLDTVMDRYRPGGHEAQVPMD